MPPWTHRRWLAVSCLALLVVLGALDTSLMSPLAAEEQSAFERLMSAKSLKCHFGAGNAGNWKSGTLGRVPAHCG